jgi:signal transduction histidine kinase
MLEFLVATLRADGFMPHGHCYLWRPEILWLHVGSDALIALAYYSIPLALLVFYRRRRDFAFPWLLVLFSAFIFACGTTHLIEIATVWNPVYRLEGVAKLLTAIVSALTAVLVWPLVPKALALPSTTQLEQEIVQRERAQEELSRMNQELEQRVAERTREVVRSNEDLRLFASAASHDLREPLRAAHRFAALLREECAGVLEARAQGYLAHVLNGTQRMERLIEDLRAYSFAFEMEYEEVELDQALSAARDALAAELPHMTLTSDSLPRVRFPKGQMARVFQNLLENAIKYRVGPEVRVHVGSDAASEPGYVRIQVSDDGMGIPTDFADVIFEPFRRLHSQKEIPGSGLGLSFCKRLVERAGGRLWVSENQPRGAVFSFTVECVLRV